MLGAVSFSLHLAWERAHIVLYTGYETLEGALPVYLFATLGDVMYTLFVAAAFAALAKDFDWMPKIRLKGYALLSFIGLGIALFVEKKAHLLDRWEYTDAMPLVYGFGLSPLIQMTALLPLSVYITVVVVRLLGRYNVET
jgi:hypothetical protein